MVNSRWTWRWHWLKAGELKRETESLICAGQEQALRTNTIKNNIDLQNKSSLCKLSKEKVEGVIHIFTHVFRRSWKPIQEETRKTWKKSTLTHVQEM